MLGQYLVWPQLQYHSWSVAHASCWLRRVHILASMTVKQTCPGSPAVHKCHHGTAVLSLPPGQKVLTQASS